MIGLMVIGFYVVFWFACGLIAKFLSKETKSRFKYQIALFLTPVYIGVIEYGLYRVECVTSETFFPEKKKVKPSSIVYYEYFGKDLYENVGSKKHLSLFNDYDFDYVITAKEPVSGKPSDFILKLTDLKVLPRIYEELTLSEQEQILSQTNYMIFSTRDRGLVSNKSTYYLVNIKKGVPVSAITSLGHAKSSQSVWMFIFPYRFDACYSDGGVDANIFSRLINNTFI